MKPKTYKPLVRHDDTEVAKAFDEWMERQPEEVRVQALCHVETVKGSIPNLGDVGAKAVVFAVYAEVLEMRG